MKYIILVIVVSILSFIAFCCFHKLYRVINPRKCSYQMFVMDVGTI